MSNWTPDRSSVCIWALSLGHIRRGNCGLLAGGSATGGAVRTLRQADGVSHGLGALASERNAGRSSSFPCRPKLSPCAICTPWSASPTSTPPCISGRDLLGLEEMRRIENEAGRFTLIFLAAPKDKARSAAERSPEVELTYNWDPETYTGGRNFGHLAYQVDDIYAACQRLMDGGVVDQPPAARRPHGLRALARRHLDRTAAGGRAPGAGRTLGSPCPTPGPGDGVRRSRPRPGRGRPARRLRLDVRDQSGRTATEQLLMARAADRAVEGLTPADPAGLAGLCRRPPTSRAKTPPTPISAIRSALSEAGYALADDKGQADAVFELRAGALSLEQMRRVVGLPPAGRADQRELQRRLDPRAVDLQPPRPGRRGRVLGLRLRRPHRRAAGRRQPDDRRVSASAATSS